MKVRLEAVTLMRKGWTLRAEGVFEQGVHLVTGRIGSGKSTLALLIAGLLAPDTGAVTTEGISSRMLAMQFPEYHITGFTVEQELASWGIRPEQLPKNLSGSLEKNPLSLSRGELKLLQFACINAKPWDLLILDEPFCSLDCIQKTSLCTAIDGLGNGIVIIMTHERSFLPRVDTTWEMTDGALICTGTPGIKQPFSTDVRG